jgi:hypothetical protein
MQVAKYQGLLSRYESLVRSQRVLQRYVSRCIKRRGTHHPLTLSAIELEDDYAKEKRKISDLIYTLANEEFEERMNNYEEPMDIEYDL